MHSRVSSLTPSSNFALDHRPMSEGRRRHTSRLANQSFEASSIELALASSKVIVYVELWMWCGAVLTVKDAA